MSNKLKTLVMYRNNTELRECPFCGSENIRLYGNDENSYWCQCISCLASTSASDDRDEAIAAWNIRTTDAVIDKLCEPIGYMVTAEELAEMLEKEN